MSNMKVIVSGTVSHIFPNAEAVQDSLNSAVYEVGFNPNVGFFLISKDSFTQPEFKIYGGVDERIKRIFKRHDYSKQTGNNTGVILSGIKGSGKSILVRKLGLYANSIGLPVILVNDAYSGVGDFIASIKQECVVVFDEFEKSFKEKAAQNELLTIIDGAGNKNKHLYLFAINESNKVSTFLFNRPGRVHYHFKYDLLEEDTIKEYLQDNIVDSENFGMAFELTKRMDCTYDVLQALCWEINEGYSKDEIAEGLNSEVKTKFNLILKTKCKETSSTVNDLSEDRGFRVRIPSMKIPLYSFFEADGTLKEEYDSNDKAHFMYCYDTFVFRNPKFNVTEDGRTLLVLDTVTKNDLINRVRGETCLYDGQAKWFVDQIESIEITYDFHKRNNHAFWEKSEKPKPPIKLRSTVMPTAINASY